VKILDEKPQKSLATASFTTIDPKTLSILHDATKSIARIDPTVLAIRQDVARSFQSELAASVGESLAKLTAPAISEALKGFQTARLVDTNALGETLNAIHARHTLKALNGPVVTPAIAEALRPGFREALRSLAVPPALSAGVNEALKDLARMPRFEVGPSFAAAVREAAFIAESPAVRTQVEETLVDFDDLSPVQRRELQKDVANAIAAILTLVAYLIRDDRVELASICLALAAVFVSIYWRVTGKLDE
jgi:hypothetical protein